MDINCISIGISVTALVISGISLFISWRVYALNLRQEKREAVKFTVKWEINTAVIHNSGHSEARDVVLNLLDSSGNVWKEARTENVNPGERKRLDLRQLLKSGTKARLTWTTTETAPTREEINLTI